MTAASHTPASEPVVADGLCRCDDDARWDQFAARSPQGSAFVASWFLRALDVEVDRWILGDGARAKAGAVVLHRGGQPVDAPYPFSTYQSLLLAPEVASGPPHRAGKEIVEVTDQLLTALAARYPRLSLCLHPAWRDVRGIQWFRYGQPEVFHMEVRYTGLVDLAACADFEAYLETVRSTRRYEHRRALSRGLVAEPTHDVDMLDALHAATFARQGLTRPAHEAALMRALASAALQVGAGQLLVCRAPSGEPASATLFLHDARCGYYLFGANAPELRSLNGGTFLVMEAIRRCQARGLPTVDLCGVNSPQRGDFKTSLGAAVTPYFLARLERTRV